MNSEDKLHVMVDIETYDIVPKAVILSIGACVIDDPSDTFYTELDINTQFERTTSLSTEEWWAKQSNPPIHGMVALHNALTTFSEWLKSKNIEPVIWCKGTDFDVAILTNAYNSLYIPMPWKYNNVRDCRTVFKLSKIDVTKAGHNALQDAIEQASDLKRALDLLGVKLA